MALIGLRDRIPDLFTIILANSAIFASLVLIHDGLIAFAGKIARRAFYTIPFVLLVLPL
ncbi:MAG TPA: hypothetical protein VMW69_14285 [Spirochaetia bacterium]|nr:hypothetical protein [Spirochaetia bacterium]